MPGSNQELFFEILYQKDPCPASNSEYVFSNHFASDFERKDAFRMLSRR